MSLCWCEFFLAYFLRQFCKWSNMSRNTWPKKIARRRYHQYWYSPYYLCSVYWILMRNTYISDVTLYYDGSFPDNTILSWHWWHLRWIRIPWWSQRDIPGWPNRWRVAETHSDHSWMLGQRDQALQTWYPVPRLRPGYVCFYLLLRRKYHLDYLEQWATCAIQRLLSCADVYRSRHKWPIPHRSKYPTLCEE